MAELAATLPGRGTTGRLTALALVPGALLIAAAWVVVGLSGDHGSTVTFTRMWVAMTIAMMLPTTVRPMLRAADGSPARAWQFAAGFAIVWLVAGVPAYLLLNAVTWTPFWIAVSWFVAGLYQVTPFMHRQLRGCRSVAYRGNAASYGLRQGLRCVLSCGPLMIAVMVTAMAVPGVVLPLLAFVAVTALLCWQNRPAVTSRSITAVGVAMLLVTAGGFVVLGGGGAPHHSAGVSTS